MGDRVEVDGKHLRCGGRPFRVRGATYGSFVARLVDGEPFPDRQRIKQDFTAMAERGLNTVRTYELPPVEMLDIAAELDMRLVVGLHFEDWLVQSGPGRRAQRRVLDAGARAVDQALERCAGRPEVLAVAVGNEVPADVVRLHGAGNVERGLGALVARLHDGDPALLTTYANYPTTEYLQIDDLDIVSFNVFLEDPGALRRYLRHLQVVAGDRPLLVSELGLASAIHGEVAQADALRDQLQIVEESGCAGATVFAWTDEWGVAGEAVTGWGFGITDELRRPKPALDVVSEWAMRPLAGLRGQWPTVSVVVCAYNEEKTLDECLASLLRCDYPALEVIVCDDGSTDATLDIARRYPFRTLELDHGGLSRARNAGSAAATGEIVAFIDADAWCHPEWPYHLALSLEDPSVAATGGPNLPAPVAPLVERIVARCPGNPTEVLIADDRAEHVPGCNMAFRRVLLAEIGGFDPVFTSAGDDVDVCWKLLDRGYEIGFAPAAQIRHHRRGTVRGYLRQQRGYGRAEKALSGAHPHRFNRLGQARWRGFIYGGSRLLPALLRPVAYHGAIGSAPFQPVFRRPSERAAGYLSAMLPLLLVALLGCLAASLLWPPALVLAGVAALVIVGAGLSAATAPIPRGEPHRLAFRGLVGVLYLVQPVVRTWARLRGARYEASAAAPSPVWLGDRLAWLLAMEQQLRAHRCAVRTGGPHDGWDLETRIGLFTRCRITAGIVWGWEPRWSRRCNLRWRTVLILVLTAGVALVAPVLAIVVSTVVVVAIASELVGMRHVINRVVERTTSSARTPVVTD